MSRKSFTSDNPSLFPFLSILTCTIGVLALMITLSVYAKPFFSDEPDPKKAYEQYVKLTSEIDRTQGDITQYQQLVVQAEALQKKLIEMRQEYDRLQQQQSEHSATAAELGRLLSEIGGLRKKIAELENELSKVLESLKTMQVKVENMPAPGTMRVVPPRGFTESGAKGSRLKVMTFVECHRNNIIIHPYGEKTLQEVLNDNIESSNEVQQLIKDAKAKANYDELIVLLLRPDGVKSFDKLLSVIRKNNEDKGSNKARYSEVLIPGSGPLDLSEFTKH